MKKFLMMFLVLGLISACSDKKEENKQAAEEPAVAKVEIPQIDTYNQTFVFETDTLTEACDKNSQLVCAIEAVMKCSLNPKMASCTPDKMPKFVLMEDENIIAPTHFDYKITKIKPLDAETAEVYTEGSCNGTWFGLCNGNIIYVMNYKNGEWTVKDLYAIERPDYVQPQIEPEIQ